MILVDTSVWIDHFNGHDSPEATHLQLALNSHEPIEFWELVLTEILIGLRSDKRTVEIKDLMGAFYWLPWPDQNPF